MNQSNEVIIQRLNHGSRSDDKLLAILDVMDFNQELIELAAQVESVVIESA